MGATSRDCQFDDFRGTKTVSRSVRTGACYCDTLLRRFLEVRLAAFSGCLPMPFGGFYTGLSR